MKASERSCTDYLNDIRNAAENAARFVAGVSYDEFVANDEKVYAGSALWISAMEGRYGYER